MVGLEKSSSGGFLDKGVDFRAAEESAGWC